MDILIPIGDGSCWNNHELRFCLRSIEAFARGYDRIFIVGDVPDFVQESERVRCFRIGENKQINRETRIALKVLWACKNTDISAQFVFWNDDFILVRPTDVSQIPPYQRGDLKEATYVNQSDYNVSLLATHEQLRRAGKPTFHYDLHVPVIYDRQLFIALENWWQKSARLTYGFVVKSVYCNNVSAVAGPTMPDCKMKGFSRTKLDKVLAERWVFSYGGIALQTGLKNWLQEMFPHTSKFESSSMSIEQKIHEYDAYAQSW